MSSQETKDNSQQAANHKDRSVSPREEDKEATSSDASTIPESPGQQESSPELGIPRNFRGPPNRSPVHQQDEGFSDASDTDDNHLDLQISELGVDMNKIQRVTWDLEDRMDKLKDDVKEAKKDIRKVNERLDEVDEKKRS